MSSRKSPTGFDATKSVSEADTELPLPLLLSDVSMDE
jgi:hypothetical protein